MLRRGVLIGLGAAPAVAAATSPKDKEILDLQGKTIQILLGIIEKLDQRITALEKGRKVA